MKWHTVVLVLALGPVALAQLPNDKPPQVPPEDCALLAKCSVQPTQGSSFDEDAKDELKQRYLECGSRMFNLNILKGCAMQSQGPNVTDGVRAGPGLGASVSAANAVDWGDALRKSMLFYDAQRSGDLPNDFRVRWRGDSALNDRAPNGASLAGGYYDAGDHMKLGFNLAHTLAVLAWGVVEFNQGYTNGQASRDIRGHLKNMGTFLHRSFYDSRSNLVVNVGDVNADHSWWGRPEDLSMARPAKEIRGGQGGGDMYGYAAGALAMASLALRSTDAAPANTYLRTAEAIFVVAKQAGNTLYSNMGTFAAEHSKFVYRSSRALDKLHFAAMALFARTGKQQYLNDARTYFNQADGAVWWPALTWDNMWPMGLLLCVKHDPQMRSQCLTRLQSGADQWLRTTPSNGPFTEGNVAHRPDGVKIILNWGAMGTTASYALVAQVLAKHDPARASQLRCFAEQQINYMLGSNPRRFSYMVGFGSDFPRQPHHRGASCPNRPAPCGWNEFNRNAPNPQTLVGALVGGPTQAGVYQDRRSDYQTNEVAINYNAGLTGALAALLTPGNRCSSSGK